MKPPFSCSFPMVFLWFSNNQRVINSQELFQRLDTWLSKAEEALLRFPPRVGDAGSAPGRNDGTTRRFHGENRWNIPGKCGENLRRTLGRCEDDGKTWGKPHEHMRKPMGTCENMRRYGGKPKDN